MTDLTDITRRMDSAIETLKKELTGLRTGRASVNLLDAVVVEAYGSRMPLSQVGTVNVPEPRMLTVQVWDTSMTQSVEKAIRESGLGLNPSSDGNLVRIPIPALNEERRKEMVTVKPPASPSATSAATGWIWSRKMHLCRKIKKRNLKMTFKN